ncbi:MAG: membrane protein insertase YidC [Bacteroidetes bacterium]|nr:membrane protein insertase YidC [Bacteroidota bacterium]
MKTDKNTIIGFVLLGILFFVFFWYTSKQTNALQERDAFVKDSTEKAIAARKPAVDTVAMRLDSLRRDSLTKVTDAGDFETASTGTESLVTVENPLMKVIFTNKGGVVKSVVLKKFNQMDSTPVILSGGPHDQLGYNINTSPNHAVLTSNLFFSAPVITKNADGSQIITYTLHGSAGQSISHQFKIPSNDYFMDWNILLNGADKLLTQNSLNLQWGVEMHQQQLSHTYEVQQSRLCFFDKDGYDYSSAMSGTTKDFEIPVDWVSFKQQFFNSTILSKNKFASGKAEMTLLPDTTAELFKATANLKVQVPASTVATIPMQLYYGPNNYDLLKKYNNGMENIVDLGSGIFSFVKYINRYFIMPVFNFLASFIGNYGWVIALLTLLIRLVTSPLTYKSYLSGAKMRVMKPELDALKAKFGDNQQGYAMEQMKLFREAGVNPLGGCVPALLQIPIFFALYSYFSSNIDLRGQSFLWAKDLSSYDVVAHLPFSIPMGFGDHISLFTLTAVITSFMISLYNINMTPQQSNPAMKYMPYFFPFILLFVFNRLPSALTWYYTVSNIITLGIQFVIQNYIIDHDKILAKIDQKRKTPKVKSKFQERYEQMMATQQKMKELKGGKNK